MQADTAYQKCIRNGEEDAICQERRENVRQSCMGAMTMGDLISGNNRYHQVNTNSIKARPLGMTQLTPQWYLRQQCLPSQRPCNSMVARQQGGRELRYNRKEAQETRTAANKERQRKQKEEQAARTAANKERQKKAREEARARRDARKKQRSR